MKITKQKLKTIIQEEVKSMLKEKLKEKYPGASEGMEFEDAIKLATKLKLRMVYGTRTKQWHVANEKNLDWGTAIAFNPNTQSKVSCRVSGKFFAVKFESTGDFDWRLHGVDFEAEPRGNRGSRDMA